MKGPGEKGDGDGHGGLFWLPIKEADCHSAAILRTHTGLHQKCRIWEIFAAEE